MEMLAGVLCFLNIVEVGFKIKERLRGSQEKEGASYFLNKIGELLNSVAIDLERNVYPHDKCTEMWSYLKGFESVLADKLPPEQLKELQGQINEAHRVEKLLGELQNVSNEGRQQNINLLKSTAGSFFAASTLVKL